MKRSKKRFLLNDIGIEKAIKEHKIIIKPDISDDQIQSSSLDVRIGRIEICHSGKLTLYDDQKNLPIYVPPKSLIDLFFHEQISFDESMYDLEVELRSSRGRLILELCSYQKEKVTLKNNNPNAIQLYGRDKFAQFLFFSKVPPGNGYVVDDKDEVNDLVKLISDEAETYENYILFRLGDHILKYKDIGLIDTRKKYPEEELFERYSTENYLLSPQEAVIAQLHPRVKLPKNIGIKLLHSVPKGLFEIEGHCINAGWVDPSYDGFLTGHPFQRESEVILKKGMPLALGKLFKYDLDVGRAYGSRGLKSHYQGSDGCGHKD